MVSTELELKLLIEKNALLREDTDEILLMFPSLQAPAEINMSATETDSDNGSESGSESSSESGSDSGSESGSDSGSESGTETEEEMEQSQPPAKGPKRLIQKERHGHCLSLSTL